MRSPHSSTTLCWQALITCITGVALQGVLASTALASCGDWLSDVSMKQHAAPASGLPHSLPQSTPCEQGNCRGVPQTPAPVTPAPTVQTVQEHWGCLLAARPVCSPQRSSRLVELTLDLPAGLALRIDRPPRHS